MDRLISNYTVPLAKADRTPKKVIDPTPQYATDGDPATGVPATYLTAAHYNSLMDEIVNAIEAGGLDPDKDDWGQLAQVFTKIISRFGNIKEVGKDGNGVYVIVNENGKDQKTYILSPSDLDDINKRLSAAEGTIVNHTSRLDNYGDAINRIFSQELPSKASISGNSNQDFDGNTIKSDIAHTRNLVVDNGVIGFKMWLNDFSSTINPNTQEVYGSVPSWGLSQSGNNNKMLSIVGFSKDPLIAIQGENEPQIFMSFLKETSSSAGINGKACVSYGVRTVGGNADLAEMWKPDKEEYIPGQVMMMGGEKEITLCTDESQVLGVYSTDPEYIMNVNLNDNELSIPIALKGRVPVWVEGPVTRKDKITPTNRGTARAAKKNSSEIIIGRPIHDDLNEGTRLVECFVEAVV